jgi:hypothetical protein
MRLIGGSLGRLRASLAYLRAAALTCRMAVPAWRLGVLESNGLQVPSTRSSSLLIERG